VAALEKSALPPSLVREPSRPRPGSSGTRELQARHPEPKHETPATPPDRQGNEPEVTVKESAERADERTEVRHDTG